MKEQLRNNMILGFFVLLKLCIHCIIPADGFDLHRDEYLHLDQAHHLDWGFQSVPPVTSWISWIIFQFGNSVFWVKFFPALFGALTIVVVWKIIQTLGGGYFARISGALAILFSSILRTNTLYQPNSLDILCWTAFFYFLIRYIHSAKNSYLYLGSLVIAIGFLNKYTICFLLAGFLVALLISKQRTLFLKPAFYMAIGIILLLILPNLFWQYQQGFPVITHMQELTERQLVNVDRIAFLREQCIFFLPSFFIIPAGMAGLIFYKPFKPYRIIGYNYLITLILFIYLQGKPYYAMSLYPVWIGLGAVFLEYLLRKGWSYYIRYVVIAVICIGGILFIPLTCPVFSPDRIIHDEKVRDLYKKTGQTIWEDGKDHGIPQDYADMIGWKELAYLARDAFDYLDETEKEHVFIMCREYGHAGAINYYIRPNPAAGSFNADYRNWFPKQPYELKGIIWVDRPYENMEEELASSGLPFTSIQRIGSVSNPISRERGTCVYLITKPTSVFTTKDLYNWGI